MLELHVNLCAAVPNACWVEYIPQLDELTAKQVTIEDGRAIGAPPSTLTLPRKDSSVRVSVFMILCCFPSRGRR